MNVHLYRKGDDGIYSVRVESFDTSKTYRIVDTAMYQVRDDDGQPVGVQCDSLDEVGPVVFEFAGIAGGKLYFPNDIDVQHAVLRGARGL